MSNEGFSRRQLLSVLGVGGLISGGGMLVLDYLNDYDVATVDLGDEGGIISATATEANTLRPLLPELGPLTLSCWVAAGAVKKHAHGSVVSVSPEGWRQDEKYLTNPSPTEVLRSDSFYRLSTTQMPGDHLIHLLDADGNVVDTARIAIQRAGGKVGS